ncbi:sigma-54-dependent Fis family transcriptional regulator [Rhodococcoides yunnanense]|uniref:sigma-54-dependent Fis family transcriptional regulator n=1 Tax=Rhodococcoides yunnanense TaxID=278209 RepID=UPI000A950AAD|nr:GAF domain-containing protein [Rhodococcus yunnanensis]
MESNAPNSQPSVSSRRKSDDLRTSQWLRASWTRSHDALGDDDRPSAEYVDKVPGDTVLARAARPVLASLSDELDGEPVALVLTDSNGVVLTRSGGDAGLLAALDRVELAPGFRYTETQVGTNGIGTALEVGVPLMVQGGQHFSGPLRSFSCAGVPITHPITGNVVGVIDLTADAQHSNALMLSFAKLAAARIRDGILEDANRLDRAVLNDYRAACHHSGRSVVAVGEKLLMMNEMTQQQFDAYDQHAILERTRDARGETKAFSVLIDLPSGSTTQFSYTPSFADDKLAGGIVRMKEPTRGKKRTVGNRRTPRLSGLSGRSAVWQRAVNVVSDACAQREWLILDGEAGTGKATLVSAAHRHHCPGRHLAIIDAAVLSSEEALDCVLQELDGGSDLLVRHVHSLSDEATSELDAMLHKERQGVDADPWVVLTRTASTADASSTLLQIFPKTVEVPPLRYHLEDVPDLMRMFLDASGAHELILTHAVDQQLMRLAWRGNVTQLRQVAEEISRRIRSGVIGPDELPAECRATTRRTLSRIQALERDAIVEALAVQSGDKTAAAVSLGMSRATIYRKIRELGITP